jgi:hypothetical protein
LSDGPHREIPERPALYGVAHLTQCVLKFEEMRAAELERMLL